MSASQAYGALGRGGGGGGADGRQLAKPAAKICLRRQALLLGHVDYRRRDAVRRCLGLRTWVCVLTLCCNLDAR